MKGQLEKKIVDVLKDLSVPMGNKGFRYLITAVTEVLADESMLDNMTNKDGLYEVVAKAHNATNSSSERAIRHGIECAFSLSDTEAWKKYFGNTSKKPVNKSFIAALAYAIKLEENEQEEAYDVK